MKDPGIRIYRVASSVVFRSTRGRWGALGNMAPGFPITIGDRRFRTVEAVYQACRFPHRSDLQEHIARQPSPMTAKRVAREHDADSRRDWLAARTLIMRWCLQLKLQQHQCSFGRVLTATADADIVELSPDDDFWGARQSGPDLCGRNVLGRLLMDLRNQWVSGKWQPDTIPLPRVPGFLLFGQTPDNRVACPSIIIS